MTPLVGAGLTWAIRHLSHTANFMGALLCSCSSVLEMAIVTKPLPAVVKVGKHLCLRWEGSQKQNPDKPKSTHINPDKHQ